MTSVAQAHGEGECQHAQQQTLEQGAAYVIHLVKCLRSLHLK